MGTASDSHMVGPFPPETAPPEQAQIWPGTGPLLALPRLSPEGASQAYAVSDDQRVGGSAADASSCRFEHRRGELHAVAGGRGRLVP
ncbi:hypothetical protein ACFWJW_21975 [Streptomyces sp. NPDC127097]|uniref:hypothetical protein n=1 Tax=Streptomyces sp. NPDC127097 TaxID=3347136 RepID=UPI00364D1E1F